MSALAFALKSRGHQVSGSDANASPMLNRLQEAGISTVVGHKAENLKLLGQQAEAVIWGSAISADNPENAAALEANLPIWHRAQLLAYFANSARKSIAVSGTHGKSSTSAMVAHILARLGHNPTALLGAEYSPFGSNARIGDPDLVVVEADESDGSFTLLHPTVTVVLNVEPEHLENYDNSEEELWRAFDQFAAQASQSVVYNADDENLQHRWAGLDNGFSYGLKSGEASLQASGVRIEKGAMAFELNGTGEQVARATLGAPGEHNVSNALAALSAVSQLGVDAGEAAQTLFDFHGVKRRFERAGEGDDIVVYNDYGHHPTEVARTLETARDFLQRPVVAVFQPHRYSRTQQIGRDFGPAFKAADRIIITELYSAFEEPITGVSGRIVFDAVQENEPAKDVRFAATLEEARSLALELARPGDALFCLGAGDIGGLPAKLVEDLQQRQNLKLEGSSRNV